MPPDSDLVVIDRKQCFMMPVDVEALIDSNHPARLLWEVTGQLDVRPFHAEIKTKRGCAGRPTFDPRLLISIWLYAYKRGIGSAREIERMCAHDPGMQWLTGMKTINHHTLSDFRMQHDEALKKLFENVLAMLLLKRMITLERVTQDGTKILSRVRNNSFRREGRIREHLTVVRKHIEQLGDPCANPSRQQSAQRRALIEREKNLIEALEEIAKLQQNDTKKEPQVSETDPQARFMSTRSNGVVPAYNVQITTDAEHGFIVDVETTNAPNDAQQLVPAMDRVMQATEKQPDKVIADGGYTNHENVIAMAERGIDFYGSWTMSAKRGDIYSRDHFVFDEQQNQFVCPAGKLLTLDRIQTVHKGQTYIYRAAKQDCESCPRRAECCSKSDQHTGRSVSRRVDAPEVTQYKEKMEREEAKTIYGVRSQIAEFPNLWIKEKFRLRQFRTRGLKKAGIEARWAALAYNLLRYLQLEPLVTAAA